MNPFPYDGGPYLLIYERSGEGYTAAYNRTGEDDLFEDFTYVDRIELPHLMDDAAAFRWLATNDDAYDILADMIGPEGADQLRNDTREYWFDDEEDS